MVTATVRIDRGFCLALYRPSDYWKILSPNQISTKLQGKKDFLGMILVFQSLTFTRNHFHTWPVFGLGAMKQGSNVQSHELEDGRQSSLNQPLCSTPRKQAGPIGRHFTHDKRVYMDPLILGKAPLPRISHSRHRRDRAYSPENDRHADRHPPGD